MSWCTSQQSNKKNKFRENFQELGRAWHAWGDVEFRSSYMSTCPGVGNETAYIPHRIHVWNTLLGTNISPEKSILKMMFLFPRWDTLISWRVSTYIELILMVSLGKYTSAMDPSWKNKLSKNTPRLPQKIQVSQGHQGNFQSALLLWAPLIHHDHRIQDLR